MSRSHRTWGWRIATAVLVLAACLVPCAARDRSPRLRTLFGEVQHRFELPVPDRGRVFLVDLALPREVDEIDQHSSIGGYVRARVGDVWIELSTNPSFAIWDDAESRTEGHFDLELPAVHGTQASRVRSREYLVVRKVIWGKDALTCAVWRHSLAGVDVGEAWELCARMSVQFDAPGLQPTTRDRFTLSWSTYRYELEVMVPRRYSSWGTDDVTRSRRYVRGENEAAIHFHLERDYAQVRAHPCWQFGDELQRWPVTESDRTALCDFDSGATLVIRRLTIGPDVLTCSVGKSRLQMSARDIEASREICSTMRVTRK